MRRLPSYFPLVRHFFVPSAMLESEEWHRPKGKLFGIPRLIFLRPIVVLSEIKTTRRRIKRSREYPCVGNLRASGYEAINFGLVDDDRSRREIGFIKNQVTHRLPIIRLRAFVR